MDKRRWCQLLVVTCWMLEYTTAIDLDEEVAAAKTEIEAAFDMAYHSYLDNAYPADELCPLECNGRDGLGGFSATFIDSLSSLVIFNRTADFENAIETLRSRRDMFHRDVNVSTFECGIRALGGLLSAHILADQHDLIEYHDPILLNLSLNLGNRLLKAFDTPTGLPYGTVNLMYGVPEDETPIVATAGAGSFILEFGTLSRLTGEVAFENAARRASMALFVFRPNIGLFGSHLNVNDGKWTSPEACIGSYVDSAVEYMLKGAILLDDQVLMGMFGNVYEAYQRHLRFGPFWGCINLSTEAFQPEMDAFAAFMPGLQTLYGHTRDAESTVDALMDVWMTMGFLPERYDFVKGVPVQPQYPLRPELPESIYYLYRATRDRRFLEYALTITRSILDRTRVRLERNGSSIDCGFAGVDDVGSGKLQNSMESFFLSETLMYLYLTLDLNHESHRKNIIFTTEGHPIDVDYLYRHQKYQAMFPGPNVRLPRDVAQYAPILLRVDAELQGVLLHVPFVGQASIHVDLPVKPYLTQEPLFTSISNDEYLYLIAGNVNAAIAAINGKNSSELIKQESKMLDLLAIIQGKVEKETSASASEGSGPEPDFQMVVFSILDRPPYHRCAIPSTDFWSVYRRQVCVLF